MKHFFCNISIIIALFCAVAGLTGCEPQVLENDSVFSVNLESVSQMSVKFTIKAENISGIAYMKNDVAVNYADPSVIFQLGEAIEPKSGTVTVEGLDPGKTYYFSFAAKIDDADYYDGIVKIDATTSDVESSDLVTILEKDKRSFKARINVPQSVKDADHALKWQFWSLPMYLLLKYDTPAGYKVDAEMVAFNGNFSGNYTQKDTTIYVGPENEYLFDENGDFLLYEGEMIEHHLSIAPGEPIVFLAGELGWGNTFENWGFGFGNDQFDYGWWVPEFKTAEFYAENTLDEDYYLAPDGTSTTSEDSYWTGAWQRFFFMTEQPELLETGMTVEVVDVTPVDATIDISIDENVYTYSYYICSDSMYKVLLNDVLLGHDEWMQWLVSSYYGFDQLYIMGSDKDHTVHVLEENAMPLSSNTDYHVFVTATSDFDGTKQCFIHKTFTTESKKLGVPEIIVTPVENGENIYEAKFNIKAPNKDLADATYGANYKREFIQDWNSIKDEGYDYTYFTSNPFSQDEIDEINSDAGLTISIPSLDGETVRLAVYGRNSEYTYSELYSPETQGKCSAIADCDTKLLPLVPKVNSELFSQLAGEWTATVKVWVSQYVNNQLQNYVANATFDVSIMETLDVPELTEEVYQIYADAYAGKEGAEITESVRMRVNAEYELLKENTELFNKYRLTYRNRLLCLGWLDYDYQNGPSRLSTQSPFDLFSSDIYSSYDVGQIFYEFGPKWYLEIAEDGTVTAPFDWNTQYPMAAWQDMEFYFGAYDYNTNHGYEYEVNDNMPGKFPVEISDDRNTIVIKGVDAAVDTTSNAAITKHYPNAIGSVILRPVISDITLKRKTSKSVYHVSHISGESCVRDIDISGTQSEKAVCKSMTALTVPSEKKKKKDVVEYRVMSMDTFRNRFPER